MDSTLNDLSKMLGDFKKFESKPTVETQKSWFKSFAYTPSEKSAITVQTPESIIAATLRVADRLYLRERRFLFVGSNIESQGLQTVANILCGNDPIDPLRSVLPPTQANKATFDLIQELINFRKCNTQTNLNSVQAAELSLKYVERNFKESFLIQSERVYKKDELIDILTQILDIENGRKPTSLTIAFHLYRAGFKDEAAQVLQDEMGEINDAFIDAMSGDNKKLSQCPLSDPIEILFSSVFTKKNIIGSDQMVDSFIHANVDNYIWYRLKSSNNIGQTFEQLKQDIIPVLKNNPNDTTFFFLLLLQSFEDALTLQIERGNPFNVIGYAAMILLRKADFIQEGFVLHHLHSILLSINGCYELLDSINDNDSALILADVSEKHNDQNGLIKYASLRPHIAECLAPLVHSKLVSAKLMRIAQQYQPAKVLIQELLDAALLNGEKIDEYIEILSSIGEFDPYYQQVQELLRMNDQKEIISKAMYYQFIPSKEDFGELQVIVSNWKNPNRNGTRSYFLSWIFRNIIQSISLYPYDSNQFKLIGKFFVAMVALIRDVVDENLMGLISGYRTILLN